MSRHPSVKWAQRSDKIYLTVELPDAKDVNNKLEPEGKLNFTATHDGIPFEVDIELFDKINTEESKVNVGPRNIVYVLKKAEKKWWPRLRKQEGKPPAFLKIDWDKWVEEEDENEKTGADFDDMDFSKLDMGGDDLDMDDTKEEEDEVEAEEKEAEPAEATKKEAEPAEAAAEETKT